MTKPLTDDDRRSIAEKLMEWGNLVFIALVATQILASTVNFLAAIVGVIVFLSTYYIGYRVMKRR